MKNLSTIMYVALIGFLSSIFSSVSPKPIEIKPDHSINSEHVYLSNRNRLEKDKFDKKINVFQSTLDSLKTKNR